MIKDNQNAESLKNQFTTLLAKGNALTKELDIAFDSLKSKKSIERLGSFEEKINRTKSQEISLSK